MTARNTLRLAIAGVAAAAAVQRLQVRRRREILALTEALSTPASAPRDLAPQMSEVPEPVRRCLERVLPPSGKAPALVLLTQHGALRTSPTARRWLPFTATHRVAPAAHAFLWNARVDAFPLLHLRVLDALVEGRGSGRVLLMSAFDVSHDGGTPEMNSGSLHRFLAEAVWYPWALRPSAALRWTAIDPCRALATLTVNEVCVDLEFRFDDGGLVTGICTPGRWGRFDGRYAQRPWEGRFSDYQRRNGVLVPRHGEVGWSVDGTLEPVWKGTIDAISTVGEQRP